MTRKEFLARHEEALTGETARDLTALLDDYETALRGTTEALHAMPFSLSDVLGREAYEALNRLRGDV